MSDYLEITAAIAQKLDEVEGIKNGGANIYEYQRLITSVDKLKTFCKTNEDKLHAWMISRKSIRSFHTANGEATLYFNYLIRGYMGVNDGRKTEHEFNIIIERVCDAFRQDQDLYDKVKPGNISGHGLEVGLPDVEIDYRMFGDILVHFCEMNYWCKVRKADSSR